MRKMDKTVASSSHARRAAGVALSKYKEEGRPGEKTLVDVRFVRFDAEEDAWIMRIGRETYAVPAFYT